MNGRECLVNPMCLRACVHASVFLTRGQKPEGGEEEAPGSELCCRRPRTDRPTAVSENRMESCRNSRSIKPCKDAGG